MIKKYIVDILSNRIRVFLGFFLLSFLIFITFIVNREGTLKDYLVCSFLIGISVLGIVLPRIKVSDKLHIILGIIFSVAYIIAVPRRMFIRTELLIGNMESLYNKAIALNVCIILMLIFVLLFLTRRLYLSFGIAGIICILFTIVNYYVYSFRGSALSVADFSAIKTAGMVMNNYSYEISFELWKSILYYLCFIILGFRINVPGKGVKYNVVIALIAFICFFSTLGYYKYPGNWSEPGIDGNGTLWVGEQPFGAYLYMVMTSDAMGMKKELGYSDERLSSIAMKAEADYEKVQNSEKPNIIVIMNEAWADLRILGNLETTEPFMPFYDSLTLENNAIKGNNYVNIYGGMTADTEFEVLTGDSMALLNVSAVPYQMQINHEVSSMASILAKQGYQTIAMHPNSPNSWSRDKVYSYMGFERKVFMDDFVVNKEYVGPVLSDRSNFEQIIYEYENRDVDRPWFMFNVTIQNHSSYWGQVPFEIKTTKLGDVLVGENESENNPAIYSLDTYVNLIKKTDEALEYLINYFKNVEEPTIICMFGDHQPALYEEFYDMIFAKEELTDEQINSSKYVTPYFIWKNYDSPLHEYGDLSANYLGAVVCESAGVELSTYYKYLLNTRKDIPYLNRSNLEANKQKSSIADYKVLQYNHLVEKEFRSDIFSYSPK